MFWYELTGPVSTYQYFRRALDNGVCSPTVVGQKHSLQVAASFWSNLNGTKLIVAFLTQGCFFFFLPGVTEQLVNITRRDT